MTLELNPSLSFTIANYFSRGLLVIKQIDVLLLSYRNIPMIRWREGRMKQKPTGTKSSRTPLG